MLYFVRHVNSESAPETAVHEDRQAFAAEDEIGLAGKGLMATPAGDAVGAENGGEPQFGGAVSSGADRGHDLSGGWGDHEILERRERGRDLACVVGDEKGRWWA
jgi:hypothetical protein